MVTKPAWASPIETAVDVRLKINYNSKLVNKNGNNLSTFYICQRADVHKSKLLSSPSSHFFLPWWVRRERSTAKEIVPQNRKMVGRGIFFPQFVLCCARWTEKDDSWRKFISMLPTAAVDCWLSLTFYADFRLNSLCAWTYTSSSSYPLLRQFVDDLLFLSGKSQCESKVCWPRIQQKETRLGIESDPSHWAVVQCPCH